MNSPKFQVRVIGVTALMAAAALVGAPQIGASSVRSPRLLTFGAPGVRFVAAFPTKPRELADGPGIEYISGGSTSAKVLVVSGGKLAEGSNFQTTYEKDLKNGPHRLGTPPVVSTVTASEGFIHDVRYFTRTVGETSGLGGFSWRAIRPSWVGLLYLTGPKTAYTVMAVAPTRSSVVTLVDSVRPVAS